MKAGTFRRSAAILAGALFALGFLGCGSDPLSSTGGADSLRVTVTFPDAEDRTWLVTYTLDYFHEDDVLSERYISRPPLVGNSAFTIPAPPPGSRGSLIVRAGETASVTALLIDGDGGSTEIPAEDHAPSDVFWYLLESPFHGETIPRALKGNLVTARLKMGESAPDPGCPDNWTVHVVGGYTRGLRLGDLLTDRTNEATLSAPFSVPVLRLRMSDVIFVGATLPLGSSVDVSLDDRASDLSGCTDHGCTQSCSYYFRR